MGQDLLELYDSTLLAGTMCESTRKGIITFIFKQKEERKEIRNWQPISLLNVDYKTLSKVITKWVRSALGLVIHPDQICAVLVWNITESLVLLRDTIAYVRVKGLETCLISLDQEKTFDRISHRYMR
eukprot:g15035.t1